MVGISGDRIKNLQLFKKENQLNFPLLSDTTGSIAGKFGVTVKAGGSIERTIDGKGIKLIHDITASRWTFIINKDGIIVHVDKNVDAAKDSKNVIDVLKRSKSDG